MDAIIHLIDDAPDLYLDEIQDWIAIHQEMHIGRSALDNLIRDAGISLKLARKCASERDEVAREEFRTHVRENFVAEMIVTADESSKDDRTIFRRYARAPKGQRATIDADFVRGDRYSIVAAISVDGYVGTRIVSGSLDSAEFFDFIVEDVASSIFYY